MSTIVIKDPTRLIIVVNKTIDIIRTPKVNFIQESAPSGILTF